MRRRPRVRAASTPGAASASHNAVDASGRATSARDPSATGPSTVAPAVGHRRARRRHRVRRAAHLGQPAEGREPERARDGCARRRPRPSDRPGAPRAPPRGRAAGSAASSRPGSSSEAGAADEEPERLLGGPGPRRQQLLVELEVRDQADGPRGGRGRAHPSAADAVEHRLGADQHRHVGDRVGRRVDRSDLDAGQQCGEVVAHARDPRPDGAERAAVAVEAHRRTRGVAVRADEPVVALLDRRAAPLAPRQLPARATREEPRPPPAIQHAHRPRAATDGVAQRVGQRRAQHPVTRFLVALVDDLAPAASGPPGRPARPAPRPTSASTVGAGVSTRSAAPARRARSTATSRAFQVGARSSSSASSPSSSTTTAARSGTGAHTAARPPITTHAPARARSHVRGADRVGMFRAEASRPRVPASLADATATCAARAADGSITTVEPSGASRHVDRARAAAISVAARSPCSGRAGVHRLPRPRPRRPAATTFGGDAARRKRRQRARPSPRRPATQRDDVGRRPAPTRPPAPRAASVASGCATSASSTQPRTRRPCSGTRTIVPTRTARGEPVEQLGRQGVVERAMDGRRRRVGPGRLRRSPRPPSSAPRRGRCAPT